MPPRVRALSFPCPTCGSAVDALCVTLGDKAQSFNSGVVAGKPLRGAHPQRIRMAVRKQNEERGL